MDLKYNIYGTLDSINESSSQDIEPNKIKKDSDLKPDNLIENWPRIRVPKPRIPNPIPPGYPGGGPVFSPPIPYAQARNDYKVLSLHSSSSHSQLAYLFP